MATTTKTSSTALVLPRLVHAGVNVVTGKYLAVGTVGDTILMFPIPSGVEVVAVFGRITTAETAANATVGISGSNAEFGSLASGALPVFAAKGAHKTRVSLSDDATPQHTYITVSPSSGTWTITATIDLTVLYTAIGSS